MAIERPAFTIGIEEEYLLVDRETRDLVSDPPPELFAEASEILRGQVSPEFLRTQIEVGTRICSTVQEARGEIARLRAAISEVTGRHGLAFIAASTHPFGDPSKQLPTDKERYLALAEDLQGVGRRLTICGMHVHVEIGDPDLRIDLMGQIAYFLPHLLALSTSSPFWIGRDSGLKSYRMNVFRTMPRTGLPDSFSSWTEYERHVEVLVQAGLIQDASKLWWDVRPSARYPTLELRIPDVCTILDNGTTVAALYLCLLHMLYRRRTVNQRWRAYSPMLLSENVWRAQRYGISGSLMDYGKGELVPLADLVDELVELVRPDAEELGCVGEVRDATAIAARGTSADRQLATFRRAVAEGDTEPEALRRVVDQLIEETVRGL